MIRSVNICHITTAHSSKDIRIFHKECVSLANEGYNVFLIAFNCRTEKINNVNIVGINFKYTTRLSRIIKAPFLAYKKALTTDADIFHFHDPEFLPYAKKLIKKGEKVIYDVHEHYPMDILSKYWIPKHLRKLVSIIFDYYERKTATKLSAVVCATPAIRDRFVAINRRVTDINNFPVLNEFSVNLEWKLKKNEVCYIGGISNRRGIRELIDSMAYVKGAKLNLAGKFSGEVLKGDFKKRLGWNKVNDLGFISRKEIAEVLRVSVAGVVTLLPIPCHLESQPTKMFEYMAAGLPVIASNFPLWKKLIEKNNCGICVDPKKPRAIADAINYLVENKNIAQEMGMNGRRLIEKDYNWGKESKKLTEVYHNLLLAPSPL